MADRITIRYRVGTQSKIKIFGNCFVKKNSSICSIKIKGKIQKLKEYLEIYRNKKKKT